MIMKRELHLICVKKKKEGRGYVNIKDSVHASIKRLEYYTEKRGENLVTAIRNNTDNTRNNRTTITRKRKKKKKKEDKAKDVLSDQ